MALNHLNATSTSPLHFQAEDWHKHSANINNDCAQTQNNILTKRTACNKLHSPQSQPTLNRVLSACVGCISLMLSIIVSLCCTQPCLILNSLCFTQPLFDTFHRALAIIIFCITNVFLKAITSVMVKYCHLRNDHITSVYKCIILSAIGDCLFHLIQSYPLVKGTVQPNTAFIQFICIIGTYLGVGQSFNVLLLLFCVRMSLVFGAMLLALVLCQQSLGIYVALEILPINSIPFSIMIGLHSVVMITSVILLCLILHHCTARNDPEENEEQHYHHITSMAQTQAALPPKQSNWESFYDFDYLTRPIKWMNGVCVVFNAYVHSRISNQRTLELCHEMAMNSQSRNSLMELFADYVDFNESPQSNNIINDKGTQHAVLLEEHEKRGLDLYQRESTLSDTERNEYHQLVQKLDEEYYSKQQTILRRANELYLQILRNRDTAHGTRRIIESYVQREYKERYCDALGIMDFSIIEMIVSKLFIKQMNDELLNENNNNKPLQIVFLIAMADEHKRLNRKYNKYKDADGVFRVNINFTGEDFLNVKLNQLDFVFKDMAMFEWWLLFVDDYPKCPTKQAIMNHKSLRRYGQFHHYKEKVIALDYRNDLEPFIALYHDQNIAKESCDVFADNSYKGGAIHLGVRYAIHALKEESYRVPKADYIYVSDCDTSTNLANIGILLEDAMHNDVDIVIGSRRMSNSHVVGKPLLRQVQSQVFNALVRILLNVQVTDTQVGAKLFKSKVITDIHKDFKERSMAFDVELLKLALNHNHTITEQGIIWIDSEIESKSATQSMQMLRGLLNVFDTMYRQDCVHQRIHNKEDFVKKGLALKTKELRLLRNVLELAMNHKLYFIIGHLCDVYNAITPNEFRIFMDSLQQFIYDLLTTSKDIDVLKKEIYELAILFAQLIDNVQATEMINFILNQFPQIFDILELMYKDFDYIYVLSSLLFGDYHAYAKSFTKQFGFESFYDYCDKHKNPYEQEHAITYYDEWLCLGDSTVNISIKTECAKHHLTFNSERLADGKRKLMEMNENLSQPVTIGIITMYNLDSTSKEYVDIALASKLNALSCEYGDLENIEFVMYVIDARLVSENIELTDYIEHVLNRFNENTQHNVYGKHLQCKDATPCAFTKPRAVRFGLTHAMQDGCDYVGFIDFSNKIDIREIGNFIYDLHQHQNDKVMAIGSRRLYESQVVNKPMPYLFRSAMLNILVKLMFPDLFRLTDTQTGFKFFTSCAWRTITSYQQHLRCESIVFDIELLQCAINSGIQINELPVDFEDNSQNIHVIQSAVVNNEVFQLIKLRGRIKDKEDKNEPRFIGSGAENVVYLVTNTAISSAINDAEEANDDVATIIKIPTNIFDADFVGFLKYFVFKTQKEMCLMDQNDKITSSSLFQAVLNAPFIHDLIPDLRNWKRFNLFVMKIISSFENKNYKSIGYRISSKLGRDLVVPFKLVDHTFALTLSDNQIKYFHPHHKVIQSVFVSTIFKHKFERVLSLSSPEDAVDNMKSLIKDGIALFYRLWHRGLFDLDTNLMYDTAYYNGSLMVLDPGELINDVSLIDINTERNKVSQRYDIMEMELVLKRYSIANDAIDDILNYYKLEIHSFLTYIDNDIPQLQGFGSDQLDGNMTQFEIRLETQCPLDYIDDQFDDTEFQRMNSKQNAFLYSSVDYQSPYIYPGTSITDDIFPSQMHKDQTQKPNRSDYLYYHLIPSDVNINDLSQSPHCLHHKKINVEIGSIGPLLSDETLHQMNGCQFNDDDPTIIIINDAGSATRSGIIKYGGADNDLNTKGNIHMFNRPIYDYAAQTFIELIDKSNGLLQNGYTIVAAGDEILSLNEHQIEDIIRYFSDDNAPGLYWCDLPNAGKDILPLRLCDIYNFIKNESIAPQFIESILKQVPFLKGLLNEMDVQETYHGVFDIVDMIQSMAKNNDKAVSSSSPSRLFPMIASFLSGYYVQFVQFNAQIKLNGLKTPFFMIFKNAFLKEFKKRVIDSALLPSYTWTHITWRSIVQNGLKCDEYIWSKNTGATGKPSLLSHSNWMKIYEEMQILKRKYNIDTNRDDQNKQRIFKCNWHNCDDPFSILQMVRKQSDKFEMVINQGNQMKILSDNNNANCNVEIEDEMLSFNGSYHIVLLQSHIHGNIIISKRAKTFTTHLPNGCGYNLFYNVNIDASKTIKIIPNHVIVGVDNTLYSMEFGLMTKDALKNKVIYEYVFDEGSNMIEPMDTEKKYKEYTF
eukprot:1049656_1